MLSRRCSIASGAVRGNNVDYSTVVRILLMVESKNVEIFAHNSDFSLKTTVPSHVELYPSLIICNEYGKIRFATICMCAGAPSCGVQ